MRVSEEGRWNSVFLETKELNELERVFMVSSCERMLFLLEFISLREEAGEGRR